MLILSRKVNEKIMIGEDICISIIEIQGDHIRLGVDAPKTIKVYRQEVFDAIKSENKAASQSIPIFPELTFDTPLEPASGPGI
ncbi:MAG: carbon storage regulator CsrA [Spirochaetaceae bacterium]|jgi:carbon storage regulator|nr:carbon storage regulator CsrA [Spirochaetaceae bacterium]